VTLALLFGGGVGAVVCWCNHSVSVVGCVGVDGSHVVGTSHDDGVETWHLLIERVSLIGGSDWPDEMNDNLDGLVGPRVGTQKIYKYCCQ
jgi:hypothetical protein